MGRDTKLGYGFLFMGAAVPYLIEHLFGPTSALVVTVICAVLGVCFLVAGHNHRSPDQPPLSAMRRTGTIMLGCAVIVAICESGWHVYKTHHKESVSQPSQAQQPTIIQQQSDRSKCANIVGNAVTVNCPENDIGKTKP